MDGLIAGIADLSPIAQVIVASGAAFGPTLGALVVGLVLARRSTHAAGVTHAELTAALEACGTDCNRDRDQLAAAHRDRMDAVVRQLERVGDGLEQRHGEEAETRRALSMLPLQLSAAVGRAVWSPEHALQLVERERQLEDLRAQRERSSDAGDRERLTREIDKLLVGATPGM